MEKEVQKTPEGVEDRKKVKLSETNSKKEELKANYYSIQTELNTISFEIAQLERLFELKAYERQLRSQLNSINDEYLKLDNQQ